MSQTLDEFVAEMRTDLVRFEAEYKAKSQANPDHYPLSIPSNNQGLWFEFFTLFCTEDTI